MKVNKRYTFKCPDCGHDTIECVQANVLATSKVLSIADNEIEYDMVVINDGEDETVYQCAKCGKVIANDEDELRLKLEQEYYTVNEAFVESIIKLIRNSEDYETAKNKVVDYLKSKNIEIQND